MSALFFVISTVVGIVLALVARHIDDAIDRGTCDSFNYTGRSLMAIIIQVAIWFGAGHYAALWLHQHSWLGFVLPGAGLVTGVVFVARFFWLRRPQDYSKGAPFMSDLSIEAAPEFVKFGAQNCVVVTVGTGVLAEEVWRLAGQNSAIIPRVPNEDADDGDLVVARIGDSLQRAYDQDQLLARLRCDFSDGE